jgi:hypothetical protein
MNRHPILRALRTVSAASGNQFVVIRQSPRNSSKVRAIRA